MLEIYKNAKCAQKICLQLLEHVEFSKATMESLKRNQHFYKGYFKKPDYYRNWVIFIKILESIKKFAKEVTQLPWYKKLNAMYYKNKYEKLIKEFEEICNALKFNITTYNTRKKEMEAQDIDDLKLVKKSSVDLKELKESPLSNCDECGSGKVIKKTFRGVEIACKIVSSNGDDDLAYKNEINIFLKLGTCPFIIGFYGLSKVDHNTVMVFDWAEYGNLKEMYTNYEIKWHTKLKLARGILNGLAFMHQCNILHHDIRCENILVTDGFEAKVSNFKHSRNISENSFEIKNLPDVVIRWLAPEMMLQTTSNYNIHCEIFSFGMTLWEIYHQKIPYENIDNIDQIKYRVLSKNRETLGIENNQLQIPRELAKIIKLAWDDDPLKRPSDMDLQLKFNELYNDYVTSKMVSPLKIKSTISNF
ncbi:41972_t:CDS:2 [Gigaspora margarita]|uniref:41972_t:CDS:1 n=1 Tax=Gigaspora margarita TaxID=4874 RepID=A0ABN7UIV2_GIGMA|nr:41972_t:CDS:2 [Gigaspora margarita]